MIDDVQMRQNYITLSFSIFKFQNKRHCWVAPLLGEKNLTQHRQFHSVSITMPLSLPLDTYPYIYLYVCIVSNTACSHTLLHLQKTKFIEEETSCHASLTLPLWSNKTLIYFSLIYPLYQIL